MSDLSNYMDLIINPALKNQINPNSNNLTPEAITEAEGFSKIFSEMTDVAQDMLMDDGTINPIKSSDKEENKVFQSASQKFGPPLGLQIEDFDYSAI